MDKYEVCTPFPLCRLSLSKGVFPGNSGTCSEEDVAWQKFGEDTIKCSSGMLVKVKKISYHFQGNREKNNTKDQAQSLKAETLDHKNKTIATKNRRFKGVSKKY